MPTMTLRPTSGTGSSWSDIANAYDGSNTTSATVTTTSTNYSTRAGTFNFDTSVIPSGATINSATLTVNCKSSSSNRHTLYADINGSSSDRVINVTLNTTQSNRTADIANYMSNLTSVVLQARNSRTTSYTFTLYEIYITVDYTEPVVEPEPGPGVESPVQPTISNIYVSNSKISDLYLGATRILKAYLGDFLLYSKSLSIPAFTSYAIYEAPTIADTWAAGTDGRTLNMSSDEFLATFYDGYVGTVSGYGTVTKTSLGLDESGTYHLYEYDFKPTNYTRTILLSSGMHPYELPACFGLAHFIRFIMDTNVTHEGIKYIRENVRIKVIPIVNPWGWSQNPKVYGNVNGVNINRNVDVNGSWAEYPVYDDEWNRKGTSAWSENEAVILRDWLASNTNVEFYIDCHTGVGAFDSNVTNAVYYMSTSTIIDKIESAINKLNAWDLTKYGTTGISNSNRAQTTITDITGYCEATHNIPAFTIEQVPESTIFGTATVNEGEDIEHYVTSIATYTMELLLSSGSTSTPTVNYIFDIDLNNVNAGNTSISSNGVTLDIVGTDWTKNGTGITFGTSSFIRYNSGLCASPTGSFTLIMDMQMTAPSSSTTYCFYWGDWDDESTGIAIFMDNGNIYIKDFSSNIQLEITNTAFNTRGNYVLIYNGTTITLKNGTTTLVTANMTLGMPSASFVTFGNVSGGGKNPNGTIYGISLYNKALSDDEIASII